MWSFPKQTWCAHAHALWGNIAVMCYFRVAQDTWNSKINKALRDKKARGVSTRIVYKTLEDSWSEREVSQCLHFLAVVFKVVFISTLPAFVLFLAFCSELWSLYKNVECKDCWDNCCRKCSPTLKDAWHHSCMYLRVQHQSWGLVCASVLGGDW